MADIKISVVLPCYNEKENILSLSRDLHAVLADHTHEILVVDDNSPDGTVQAVQQLGLDWVKIVPRTREKGLALSILDGVNAARGSIVIIMDSDYNHQPRYLPFMVDALEHWDCVSGSRFVYGGGMEPRSRNLLSWLFNIFTRIATGGSITDSLYGFCAIHREKLRQLPFDQIFWGYGDYYIRMMYFAQKQGFSVLQFPAVNGRRQAGEANSRFVRVFFQYFREVLKLAKREWVR